MINYQESSPSPNFQVSHPFVTSFSRRRSSVLRTVSNGTQPLPAAVPLSADHPLSPRQRFLSSSWSIDRHPADHPTRARTVTMGHWDTLRAQFHSPKHSTASSLGLSQQIQKGSVVSTLSCPPPLAVSSSTLPQGGQQAAIAMPQQQAGGQAVSAAQPPKQQHPYPAPKSKFKMAHESFRARMLQEMQDSSEAVS